MKYFANFFTRPFIQEMGYSHLCEIGASHGENTDLLLQLPQITLDIIDPCLDENLAEKYRHQQRVCLHQELSLQALKSMDSVFDCILIDGDHNWYTVFNELQTIHERGLLRSGGTIFLHDVGWPYARRDMYYLPESIPTEFVHPYAKQGLVRPGTPYKYRVPANAHYNNALHEGGPRNGVLGGIEDFLKLHPHEYLFFTFLAEHGLGVMLKSGSEEQKQVFYRFEKLARRRERRVNTINLLRRVTRRIAPGPYNFIKRNWPVR